MATFVYTLPETRLAEKDAKLAALTKTSESKKPVTLAKAPWE